MRTIVTSDQPSTLDCVLLGLLDQGLRSGYDIRKLFTLTPFKHFSDSPGAIYPALRRLERRGWIAPAGTRSTSGRRRRPFRLTARGRRAFVAWLRRLPTRQDVVWRLDDVRPRFAFMSQALPPDEIASFLNVLAREVDAYVVELERYREAAGPMPFTGRLAFEAGIEAYRALARWARKALAQLEAERRKS